MELIIILSIILLIGSAIWFWRLSKKEQSGFTIQASLIPSPDVTVSPAKKWRAIITVLIVLTLISAVVCAFLYFWKDLNKSLPKWSPKWFYLPLIGCCTLGSTRCLRHHATRPATRLTPAFYGQATLPKRIYEGDSHNINIDLKHGLWKPAGVASKSLQIKDTELGKSIALQLPQDNTFNEFLEIELIAAGLTIDGEKKQRQPLTSQTLSYGWNCYFPNSGNHAFALEISLIRASDKIKLGAIEHTIKVVKLDDLTKRQVWVLALIAGAISGGLAIAEALRRLNMW